MVVVAGRGVMEIWIFLHQFLPHWSDLKMGDQLASHTLGAPLLDKPVSSHRRTSAPNPPPPGSSLPSFSINRAYILKVDGVFGLKPNLN